MDTAHTTNGVPTLQERLKDPGTIEALNHILDQAPVIDKALTLLAEALKQGPGFVGMFVDTLDETVRESALSGVNLEEHGRNALLLARKLTEPHTVKVLSDLLDRMDQVEQLIAFADQLPGTIAMAVDIVDEWYRDAATSGIVLEDVIRQGGRAATKFSTLMTSEEFSALMESGVLEPQAVKIVGAAGQAMVASQKEPSTQVSPFGLLRAMQDPDVQRALGFMVRFAKSFGKALSGQTPVKEIV